MRAGIAALVMGYVLSQFFRAFLAVLTQTLEADIGASAVDLSRATGLWYLGFAVMQIPVGWALDRIGPRLTTVVPLVIGGAGGAALFAMAQTPADLQIAMALIGLGCSPVLMASYYIFARSYPPTMFATLAALVVAGGSTGNVLGSIPLTWLVAEIGWRTALWGLVVVTLLTAAIIAAAVRNPPPHEDAHLGGSILSILTQPSVLALLPLMSVNYILVAGLRGLWIGPLLTDRFGLGPEAIGWSALLLGVAMIAGTALYGPLDRRLGTRKWVIIIGNTISASLIVVLALWSTAPLAAVLALLAVALLTGTSFAICIAHGRAFAPPHLAGRAVTLMNMFSIGGAGIFQYASGWVYAASGGNWTVLLLFFALPILAASVLYLLVEDRLD